MVLRSTNRHWGSLAKGFHWIVAALIFTQFALGWIAHEWPRSPTKLDLFVWHKSIGILVLLIAVLRLSWRAIDPHPALPAAMGRVERIAARLGHVLLYILMLAMPLSGWVINSAANFPLKLFWLVRLPPIAAPGKELQELAEGVHLALFWLLAGLVAVHVVAALRHHFVLRDPVLRRMLPGTQAEPES